MKVAALAIAVSLGAGLTLPQPSLADSTSTIALVEPPPPPMPAPPSQDSLRLADALVRPMWDAINTQLFPKAGPQLLAQVELWDGWKGWSLREGHSTEDFQTLLIAVAQEAFSEQRDEVIATVAMSLEQWMDEDSFTLTNDFVNSTLARSAWEKLISYVIQNFDIDQRRMRPIPPGLDFTLIMPAEELAAFRAFGRSPAGRHFRRVWDLSGNEAMAKLDAFFGNNDEGLETRFRARLCTVATAPACDTLGGR